MVKNHRDQHRKTPKALKGSGIRLLLHKRYTLRKLWQSPISGFYSLSIVCGGRHGHPLVTLVPYATDIGVSLDTAAAMLAVLGGVSVLGRLALER